MRFPFLIDMVNSLRKDAGLAKLAAAKLDLLKELRDEGLLTDEQFDQKLQLHGPAA